MATFPLATLSATISEAGISAPSFADILGSLKVSFKGIYGDDAYLEADSQDGQFLAVIAQAIHDCNQATIAAYSSFSPQTAVGVGLSNVVKINHMARLIPTKSTVDVLLAGTPGTTITNGIVGDADGNRWFLPGTVTIPPAATITVTATAEFDGAISAPIGSVSKILTPTSGWQTVQNSTAAAPGLPVESDAQLRARQEITPALNAYTVLTGLVAAIKALPGVSYGTCYENDTDTTDSNGLPAHSIALVVKGGDANQIASTIYAKKAPGVNTYGTTTIAITDASGASQNIKFTVPTEKPCKVAISLQAGAGYDTAIASAIKASVAASINALTINEDLVVNRLYPAALLGGSPDSLTYKITSLQAGLVSGSVGTTDVVIAFTEKATCLASDVTITVV